MTTAYQKFGRGGAGNFHTPADISAIASQEASPAATDLEAQRTSSPPPAAPSSGSGASAPEYRRVGRGGAGNYYGADQVAAATEETLPTTSKPTATGSGGKSGVNAGPSHTFAGRGGAGNVYARKLMEEQQRKDDEERERVEGERVSREVEADVVKGLEVPQRAFFKAREGAGG
ncbi:MAG: hypothetical protein M1825_006381 [Sarcosagium campestre]|nr:MAG: hypothetical protein M1825_006381 [Sarcosagium campestre]